MFLLQKNLAPFLQQRRITLRDWILEQVNGEAALDLIGVSVLSHMFKVFGFVGKFLIFLTFDIFDIFDTCEKSVAILKNS